jgi:DNA-binding transcriptional regulator YhcF (GntR family)
MDQSPIDFRLSPKSGVSPSQQLVQQVRQALRLGILRPGDQLPTVKQVVASLAINPNTVLKAYKELEHEGLILGRPGQGTFVLRFIGGPPPDELAALKRELDRWLEEAFAAGLDDDSVEALFATALRSTQARGVA